MRKRFMIGLVLVHFIIPARLIAADGEGLFREKCGACHKKGGEAASVNPADKAATVWDKYFKRGRHPIELTIGDGEFQEILTYLQDHAADSDQPAAAVIPK